MKNQEGSEGSKLAMRRFDYMFLRGLKVPTSFLGLTNKIYELRLVEEEKKRMYPDMFTQLQKIAVVQSVKGSNAIEGIISRNGQILGKMGHSERYEEGLFKNIEADLEQPLFENAVKYFKTSV